MFLGLRLLLDSHKSSSKKGLRGLSFCRVDCRTKCEHSLLEMGPRMGGLATLLFTDNQIRSFTYHYIIHGYLLSM